MRVGARLMFAAMAALVATLLLAPVAQAFAPVGACCLPGGACESLIEITCLEQNGTFVGVDTSCLMVTCQQSVGVPMLSILGLVAAVGALAGVGIYRLLTRRYR